MATETSTKNRMTPQLTLPFALSDGARPDLSIRTSGNTRSLEVGSGLVGQLGPRTASHSGRQVREHVLPAGAGVALKEECNRFLVFRTTSPRKHEKPARLEVITHLNEEKAPERMRPAKISLARHSWPAASASATLSTGDFCRARVMRI